MAYLACLLGGCVAQRMVERISDVLGGLAGVMGRALQIPPELCCRMTQRFIDV